MHLDTICEIYYNTCLKLRLRPQLLPEIKGFRIVINNRNFYFRAGNTPLNDCSSASLALNKYGVNKLLKRANFPVPKSIAFTREEYKTKKLDLDNLQFPVVVKPTWNSMHGRDVFCNIKDKSSLVFHLERMYKKHECVSVEEFKSNLNSYRVLVFDGKAIALTQRFPAKVIGDSVHTILQLIDISNKKRRQVKKETKLPLGALKIMDETKVIFEELGINEHYIPNLNEVIPLRYICNSTFGGSMRSLPIKALHPYNAQMACRAAQELNLNLVGFDIICPDISEPIEETDGYFLEANYDPDISIHEYVTHGEQVRVSEIILKTFCKKNNSLFKKWWL